MIATRPVSQSMSTSNLRSPAATVMRPPLLPPSGKKRIDPTLSLTRSFWAVKSLSSIFDDSLCSCGSLSTLNRLPATSSTRNVWRRCDTASLCARRRPAASWRAVARNSLVDTGPPNIGITKPATIAISARTISSSRRVTPLMSLARRAHRLGLIASARHADGYASASRNSRSAAPFEPRLGRRPRPPRSFPIRDVLVRAFPAFDAIGPERNDVVRAMRARIRVFVVVPPGILRRRGLLPVGAGPVRKPGRRDDQRLQAFLRGRITAELELEQVEGLADLVDLDLGRLRLRLLALAEIVAADDAEHDADQRQHDEDLDQRHAALRRIAWRTRPGSHPTIAVHHFECPCER